MPFAVKAMYTGTSRYQIVNSNMLLLNTSLTARKFQRVGALLYLDGCIQEFLMGTYRVGELEEGGENDYHQAPQISLYLTLTSGHISNKRCTVKPLKQQIRNDVAPVIPDVLRN